MIMRNQEIAQLLLSVLRVIDSTDTESSDFIDSGADSVGMLMELEEEIRDTVLDLTGTYPKAAKEFDVSEDIQLQG
jgi:hypothetical protein